MIVNIRGTNGSGKTTIYRRIIDEHDNTPLYDPVPAGKGRWIKPIAFGVGERTYCLGRYQAGCDGIIPHTMLEELLRHYALLGDVVFENVLVSGNNGRWLEIMREFGAIIVVLDTPFRTCLERIYARREEARASGWKHRKETIDERLIEVHYRRVHRRALDAAREGVDVRLVSRYEQVHDLLFAPSGGCPLHGILDPDGAPAYVALPDDGGFSPLPGDGGSVTPSAGGRERARRGPEGGGSGLSAITESGWDSLAEG